MKLKVTVEYEDNWEGEEKILVNCDSENCIEIPTAAVLGVLEMAKSSVTIKTMEREQ